MFQEIVESVHACHGFANGNMLYPCEREAGVPQMNRASPGNEKTVSTYREQLQAEAGKALADLTSRPSKKGGNLLRPG